MLIANTINRHMWQAKAACPDRRSFLNPFPNRKEIQPLVAGRQCWTIFPGKLFQGPFKLGGYWLGSATTRKLCRGVTFPQNGFPPGILIRAVVESRK